MNMPAPKLVKSWPDESNLRMRGRFEPAQEFAPHLSATQMFPWESTATPAAEPHVLPSGSLAQFVTVRYGLGCEFGSFEAYKTTVAAIAPATTKFNVLDTITLPERI